MIWTIAHLITSLEGGGTENFLFQLLSRSPAAFKHKVFYIKRDGVMGDRIRRLGIPVKKTGGLLGTWQTMNKEKPDVLHTCLYRAHQIGRFLGHRAGIPVVLSSQRSIDAWAKPWHRWIDQWTLKNCDYLLVNSEAAQKLGERRRGARSRPLIIKIYNGLDTDQFVRQDRWKARQAYNLPLAAVVGGSLLRLHHEKGADRIPDFAGQILTARPTLHLLVGGTGPMASSLKKAVHGKPWANRLHWTGWEENTPRFLSAIDFFWSLSREESFPQSLLEASGLGVPWIAPQVGGTAELLEAGAGGLIYSTTNPLGAVHSAYELLRLLNEMKQKAERAAPSLRSRYSLTKMVESFYDFLTKAVSRQ